MYISAIICFLESLDINGRDYDAKNDLIAETSWRHLPSNFRGNFYSDIVLRYFLVNGCAQQHSSIGVKKL